MLRFIFYLIFGYLILKIVRVFIDPLFQQRPVHQRDKQDAGTTRATPGNTSPKLGDYVEFEEIK
jgi:hypothetical protein